MNKGYLFAEDLIGLKLNTVKTWIMELKWDSYACHRLNKLLTNDPDMLKNEYELCDMSTIRESFLHRYDDKNSVSFGKDYNKSVVLARQ